MSNPLLRTPIRSYLVGFELGPMVIAVTSSSYRFFCKLSNTPRSVT